MKAAMVDIETMSTSDDAAVIAIGTVIFDRDEILAAQSLLIDPITTPGHRSVDTLEWWNRQAPEVRERMFSGTTPPSSACLDWVQFLEDHEAQDLWANAPTFDITILRSLFRNCGLRKFPIHHRKERDFRTLTSLARDLGIEYKEAYRNCIKHDAVSDATAQARAVQIILNTIHRSVLFPA